MKAEVPIQQDGISLFFFAFASSSLIFIFLQGGGFTAPLAFGTIVAIILMALGLVGSFLFKYNEENLMTDEKAALSIALGFVLALGGFIIFNAFIPQLSTVSASSVAIKTFFGTFALSTATLTATVGSFIFAVVLIPTSEENFFRGFFANLFISKTGKFAGVLVAAIIFMIFHIPADGYNLFTLGIIFMDGVVIAAVDVETGRLSTGILAHVGNNALSWLTVTGAIVLPAPLFLMGVPLAQFVSLPLLLVFLAFVRSKRHSR